MEILTQIFGEGKDLNSLHMAARTVVMFIITLFLIRIAGTKTFGKNSVFDNIVIIMLGAVLSRGIVGASPFMAVVAAGFAMVLMTRFVSWLSIKSESFRFLARGHHTSLYKNGVINNANLSRSLLSKSELMESVRKETNTNSLEGIEEVFLECNGDLSVIKKKKE